MLLGRIGGGWNHCLDRAQLNTVPDGDVVVLEVGASFAASEIIDALLACRTELRRVPSLNGYIGWTRDPRSSGELVAGRSFNRCADQAIGDARSSTSRVDGCAASASWVAAHVASRRIASCDGVPGSTE